jgi:outer membrane protein assembly factor BamB
LRRSPAAGLPWPEGAFGVALLVSLSCSPDVDPTGIPEIGRVRTRWVREQPNNAYIRPHLSGGLVYFGAGAGPATGGLVIARTDGSGEERWRARVANVTPPDGANMLVRAGVLVVPVVHYTVGLDAASGRELWRYEAPRDTVHGRSNPGQVVGSEIDADDAKVYIPAWGASVSAVDVRTGTVRWVWQPGLSSGDTAAAGVFRSGAAGVAVAGDTVFVTVWHNLDRLGLRSEPWLVALDAATGRELWRVVVPSYTGGVTVYGAPVVHGGRVIFTGAGGDTWAVDRATQQLAWHFAAHPTAFSTSTPELYGDAIYFDAGDNHIIALSAAHGTQLWKAHVGGYATHELLVTERRVYVPWGMQMSIFDRASGRLIARVRQPGRDLESFIASPATTDGRGRIFVTVDDAAWSFDEP